VPIELDPVNLLIQLSLILKEKSHHVYSSLDLTDLHPVNVLLHAITSESLWHVNSQIPVQNNETSTKEIAHTTCIDFFLLDLVGKSVEVSLHDQ
jgi:hypothetical protein